MMVDNTRASSFSQSMRITEKQMHRMARLILEELLSQNVVTFKAGKEKVQKRVYELIKKNYDEEQALDQSVNAKLDELERQHPGEFQRFKMFPMLKKKMAEEKGIIL